MGLNEMFRVGTFRTWTNLLTFELDPDHSMDAGTGLLISYELQRGILLRRGKSHV